MMDKTDRLRENAEKELQKAKKEGHIPTNVSELINELKVHQIELEMQNEELRKSQEELEKKVEEQTAKLEKTYDSLRESVASKSKILNALKESESKFHELFNNALDVIALSELQENMLPGRLIEVNETAIRRSGYTKEELLNLTPLDLFAPDTQNEIFKIAAELLNKGYTTFETEYITKDKSRIPAEVNVHIFELNGKKVALAIARDITERKKTEEALKESLASKSKILNDLKESEAKYRELFDKSTDMISLSKINEDGSPGKYIEVNEIGLKRLGYTKEEILNMGPIDIIAPDKRVEIPKNAVEMAKKGFSCFEIVHLSKEGKIIPVEIYGHIINYQGQKVYLTVSRDITERKKAEKKLKETVNELERSNDELQRFAYVASHDLQEPLRTISSFTQLLERRYKDKLDSDADEFIEYVVEAAQRMQQMIQDLLEYSRVSTKSVEFKPVNSDIVLNKVINGLKNLIDDNNAEITHDPLPEVTADENQLYRIFQNLIVNAIKFRKENIPPKIHISASIDEEKNEYIFSVSDNSIGIESQYFDRIFTIFQRLHTRDEYQGTGIGLSIVKRIVDRHGGRMWVESKLGVGSVFYFTLSKP
ncbi:MAG TPA: PAS domain S-box protein [Methanobacterium sp.]|nr:PAS domain S-box protein [Methanobacterium sp.]